MKKIVAVNEGVMPKSVIAELREEIKEIRAKFAKEIISDVVELGDDIGKAQKKGD
jgi:hypothetical protein